MPNQLQVENFTKFISMGLPLLISIFVISVASQYISDIRICCALAQEEEEISQISNASKFRGEIGWANYAEDILSISTETSAPISGNGSLRVDVQPTHNITEAVNSTWSVVSTDFIPVKEGQVYNYGLEVSATDVNQLHSKVVYYDLNKNEINSTFIFVGMDGTFQDKFSNSNISPNGTKYAQIQLWVRPTLEKSAFYIIDNVELSVRR